MSFDPKSLLSKPADSYEKPKAVPAGTYRGRVAKFKFGKWPDANGEEGSHYVDFTVALVEPFPDVDEKALADALGEGKLTDKVMSYKKNITPEAMAYLGEFLVDHLGCEAGISAEEQIQQSPGREAAFTVVNNPGKGAKANEIYANITGSAAL